MIQQIFNCDFRLLQNGLQGFRFDFTVHWHTGMQRILDIMPVRTGLTDKLKAQPFQGAADFIAGKIARQFHAGWRDKTGSSTKCSRMSQCSRSSFASNRHWIKSRIVAICHDPDCRPASPFLDRGRWRRARPRPAQSEKRTLSSCGQSRPRNEF